MESSFRRLSAGATATGIQRLQNAVNPRWGRVLAHHTANEQVLSQNARQKYVWQMKRRGIGAPLGPAPATGSRVANPFSEQCRVRQQSAKGAGCLRLASVDGRRRWFRP
jgi:hypothetical protein